MKSRAEVRKELIARRDAMPAATRAALSRALASQVRALPQYAGARSVLATMAIGSEWDTGVLLRQAIADGKVVVLPRISPPPRRLELYAVPDLDRDLKPGVWNIPEPDPERCERRELSQVDLALVPALAVDPRGYRLGYGAGYFDKLLSGRGERPYCVTALPAAFHVPHFDNEPHDVPVDLVLSEAGPVPRHTAQGNP